MIKHILLTIFCFSLCYGQYTIKNGPSYDWKHHNPELQAILNELREKEVTALEHVRLASKMLLAEWQALLESIKARHRARLQSLHNAQTLKLQRPSAAYFFNYLFNQIVEEFERQLCKLGINPTNIGFYIIQNPEPGIMAFTNGIDFWINIEHAAWQNSTIRKTVIAHEIGHFLDGHSQRAGLIKNKVPEELSHALTELDKINELIADLLVALYDPARAYTVHRSFVIACTRLKDREKPYTSNKEVRKYTQRIVRAHEKEFYHKLSGKNKIRFYVAKIFGSDALYARLMESVGSS